MEPSAQSYICPTCGQTHKGLPTDIGYTLPDDVWAIPEDARTTLAKWTTDLCQLGERYFIRCLLKVPFRDRVGYFGWGLWVEVKWPVFQRYNEIYDCDGSLDPAHAGILANQLPGYDKTVGAEVSIKFGSSADRPTIHFPLNAVCVLSFEQTNGIDYPRYHDILEANGSL